MEVAPAAGGLEGGDQLAQSLELVGEQLVVAGGRLGIAGGEPAQLGLAIQGVVDRVTRGVVLALVGIGLIAASRRRR